MLKFFIFLSSFIVSFAFIHPDKLSFQERIIGGKYINITEAPHQVALFLDFDSFGKVFMCGGSIIADDIILTASSCSDRYPNATKWEVRAGSSNNEEIVQVRNVSKIVLHPDFTVDNNLIVFNNDISLFFLSSPLILDNTTIKIIPLPKQNDTVEDGVNATISGWGSGIEGSTPIERLKQLTLPVLNQETCVNSYLPYDKVTESMICIGSMEGGEAPCSGDVGSAFLIDDVAFAIYSWARRCGKIGLPAVATRVSLYRSWIDSEIRKK